MVQTTGHVDSTSAVMMIELSVFSSMTHMEAILNFYLYFCDSNNTYSMIYTLVVHTDRLSACLSDRSSVCLLTGTLIKLIGIQDLYHKPLTYMVEEVFHLFSSTKFYQFCYTRTI